jgi:YggT family protein
MVTADWRWQPSTVLYTAISQVDRIMPFLARLIDLYSLVVLVAVILSWVPLDRRNPLVTIARSLTEPVLAPIRKVLPPMGGLDLSPMVLLIALQILKGLLL